MITRNSFRLDKFWPFSIKTYVFIFIIVMSLVFGFLGWGMQYKLESIRSDAHIRNQQDALDEIAYVLNHITHEINYIGKSIAGQDETIQQFFNRDYYHHWRDKRILGTAVLPEYVLAVELYTTQGNALTKQTIGDMPKRLPGQLTGNFVTRQTGHNFLYIFSPVTALQTNATLGYIGFKIDILAAIKSKQRFSHVDINTLELNIGRQNTVSMWSIMRAVQDMENEKLQIQQI